MLDGEAVLAHCARQHAPETYARWLGDGRSRLWLAEAEIGGAPVGYAVTAAPDLPAPDPRPTDIEIKRIYVLGRAQGRGLGRGLIEAAFATARESGARRALLGVYADNASAIGFYAAVGFEVVGERRFRIGQRLYDDVVMAKLL